MGEKMSSTAKQVAEYIIANPGCDRKAIRAAVNIGHGTFESAIKTATYWYYLWEEESEELTLYTHSKTGNITKRIAKVTRYHVTGEQFKAPVMDLEGISGLGRGFTEEQVRSGMESIAGVRVEKVNYQGGDYLSTFGRRVLDASRKSRRQDTQGDNQ